MAIQRTFSIIKPDATKRNLVGAITAKLEAGGLACHRAKADSINFGAGAGVLCCACRTAVLWRIVRVYVL